MTQLSYIDKCKSAFADHLQEQYIHGYSGYIDDDDKSSCSSIVFNYIGVKMLWYFIPNTSIVVICSIANEKQTTNKTYPLKLVNALLAIENTADYMDVSGMFLVVSKEDTILAKHVETKKSGWKLISKFVNQWTNAEGALYYKSKVNDKKVSINLPFPVVLNPEIKRAKTKVEEAKKEAKTKKKVVKKKKAA